MKRWIIGVVGVVVLAVGAGSWFLSSNLDEIVRADATDTLPYKVAPLVNSDGEDVVSR